MKRIAVLAALAVLLIGGTIAAQQEMSGSERYRAEKCAGQYTCDEDGAGADLWTRQQTTGTHRVSQHPEKSSGTPTNVQAFDDKQVLVGLSEVKVAFDITAGDGKGLLNRLNVIDETRQSLIKQGVNARALFSEAVGVALGTLNIWIGTFLHGLRDCPIHREARAMDRAAISRH
jgi:hypothetical protein